MRNVYGMLMSLGRVELCMGCEDERMCLFGMYMYAECPGWLVWRVGWYTSDWKSCGKAPCRAGYGTAYQYNIIIRFRFFNFSPSSHCLSCQVLLISIRPTSRLLLLQFMSLGFATIAVLVECDR